eukprot:5968280-Pleurochrysis_carterae.AAC.2
MPSMMKSEMQRCTIDDVGDVCVTRHSKSGHESGRGPWSTICCRVCSKCASSALWCEVSTSMRNRPISSSQIRIMPSQVTTARQTG